MNTNFQTRCFGTVVWKNWNDTEKISMAPAQGWHAQIENVSLFEKLKSLMSDLNQRPFAY